MININAILLFFLVLAPLLAFLHQENIKRFLRNIIFSNKSKEGKYVKICPKCGSLKIQVDFSNPVVWAYGTAVKYKCKSCRHLSALFPEVLEEDIEKYRKELKFQIKEGKLKLKKEEMIDTSAGFSIGMLEVITGVIAFLLIPLTIIIKGET